jgi:ribosome-associated heat shock protein Hsp15
MTETVRMRVDLWLFRVRLFKTRAAAADLVATSGVRIERDGQVRRSEKPSTEIAPGDMLSLPAPEGPRLVRIVSLPQRRGPPAEARACYELIGVDGRTE